MGTTKGVLNLQQPSFMSLSGNNLIIGTEGNNDLVFLTNNVERLRIAGNGSTTLSSTIDFTLANNDYLLSKNAAGSGTLSLLKSNSNDDTVLNAATGKRINLSIGDTAAWKVGTSSILGAVATGTNYLIGTSSVNAADSNVLTLAAGDTTTNPEARGGWAQFTGNESAGAGRVDIQTGDATGSLNLLVRNGTGSVTFGTGSLERWSVNSSGNLVQDGSNGGGIVMSRGLANLKGLLTGTSSFDTDITTNITATQGLGISQDKANGSDHVVLVDYGASVQGVRVNFLKTRSGSSNGNANTIVNSGDNIGTLLFAAADGVQYRSAAAILANVDGTPGSGDMPGNLDFQVTLDGTVTLVSFLKISQSNGFNLYRTNTAGGTTGAQTINKPNGSVNFAAGATSLVVTNSMVSTSSNIIAVLQTNDATARVANVVPGSGSFTINLTAAATAETRCAFWVFN